MDESGQAAEKAGSNWFVLAGVALQADQILALETEVARLKVGAGLFPDTEVKWSSRYSDLGLSYAEFKLYREGMFNLIAQYSSKQVIAIAINKKNAYAKPYIRTEQDLYVQCLFLLMERFHYFIEDQAQKAPAMIVVDSRKSAKNKDLDDELRKAY